MMDTTSRKSDITILKLNVSSEEWRVGYNFYWPLFREFFTPEFSTTQFLLAAMRGFKFTIWKEVEEGETYSAGLKTRLVYHTLRDETEESVTEVEIPEELFSQYSLDYYEDKLTCSKRLLKELTVLLEQVKTEYVSVQVSVLNKS